MIGPVFVDTNVLVYRHDASDPVKQSRAHDWLTFFPAGAPVTGVAASTR